MGIEYFSKVMSELFHQHNYRDMFDFWLEKIRPELKQNQKAISELKEWIIGVVEYVNLKPKETKDES